MIRAPQNSGGPLPYGNCGCSYKATGEIACPTVLSKADPPGMGMGMGIASRAEGFDQQSQSQSQPPNALTQLMKKEHPSMVANAFSILNSSAIAPLVGVHSAGPPSVAAVPVAAVPVAAVPVAPPPVVTPPPSGP